VEEALRALYRLQQIDLELDELDDSSGELPIEVEGLRRKIDALSAAIEAEETKHKDLKQSRIVAVGALEDQRERLRNLNERLRTVRNNKEYEATTAEIETAEGEIQAKERGMVTLDAQEAIIIRDTEELSRQREELVREVDEKSGTLATIRETHADEVTELKNAREAVEKEVTPELMKRYKHIRTAYPDAVVRVRKGACSGCYRAIPPQMIVEMRRYEQLFICEHCGRILVDEEITNVTTI
jgi:predicted  nucleic acid-binding Zn-ribbon protein